MSELPTLTDLCTQRSKKQQMHIPISRFDTESPYTTKAYTQFDLDMRRKVEILQYSNISSNNKTNNLTKKQKMSEFTNNRSALKISKSESSHYNRDLDLYQVFHSLKTSDNSCPNVVINTNSTYSNVPGNINLYKDDSVPLYKYKDHIINYGIFGESTQYNLLTNYASDTYIDNNSRGNILSLYTINPLSETTYIDFNIPIAFYIRGVAKSSVGVRSGRNMNILNNTISIQNVVLNLSFNGISIKTITSSILSTINFDISFNYSANNTGFNGTYYLKNILIPNVEVNTTSDFVYDVEIDNVIDTNSLLSLSEFDLTVGILANTDVTSVIQEDCSFNTLSSDTYAPLKVEGYTDSFKQNKLVVKNVKTNSLINVTNSEAVVNTPNYDKCLTDYVYFETTADYSSNTTIYNLKNTEIINSAVKNIYNVLDVQNDRDVIYNLKIGTYYFINIHKSYPIALSLTNIDNDANTTFNLFNNNQNSHNYGIVYSGYDTEFYETSQQLQSEAEPTVFYYGSVKLVVSSVFDDISLCTYYDGSKRDVNVTFRYNSTC